MISVRKLLGKDDQFLNLLEASAQEGQTSAQALKRLLEDPAQTPSLEELTQAHGADKQIRQDISEQITKTFVTSLEREDIEALANALYRIPKTIQKFAQRFVICAPHVKGKDFRQQAALLGKATGQVVVMVKQLRKMSHLEVMKEENARLQRMEGEGDKVMLELLRDLYSGRHKDLEVIALKELYELLEKVIDRCRDAGNVITHITLKHS
jgi:hypothetical protein